MRALRFIAPAFAIFLVAGEAHAAAPSPDDPTASASASASVGGGAGSARRSAAMGGNRFRLHVDGEFFGFGHFNPDGGPDDDGTNAVGFGVGRGLSTHVYDNGVFGINAATPLMGVGFGVLILQQRAVVGARVGMSLTSAAGEADDSTRFTFFGGELLPYFRYLFLDGAIRPYAEGHFGFGGGLSKTTFTNPVTGAESSGTSHTIAPIVGAAGGAMFFLNDHFSIDLGLNFDYLAPHGRSNDDDPDTPDEDWEKIGDQVSLTINTGISGWF